MGVRGLTKMVNSHPELLRDVHFKGERLLIDGDNLKHVLYNESGLDQNHGGEYEGYEALMEKFVDTLRGCKILPYVVMDGGLDITLKKMDTIVQRTEERHVVANKMALGGDNGNLLPLLASEVFVQTLQRLEVPVAMTFDEADREIAALAQRWSCPVLSNDSDFFIYDLPGGFLPISHFCWVTASSFIPCKRYNINNLCILFKIQKQLLPAFASLAGNDYVKVERKTLAQIWRKSAPTNCAKNDLLVGLLYWLRDLIPEEVLEKVMALMGDELTAEQREALKHSWMLSMKEYQLPPSSLESFFLRGIAPSLPPDHVLVPDWMQLLMTEARLTSRFLDVLRLQIISLRIMVAHRDQPCPHLISRPLRQVMYGLLFGPEGGQVKELETGGSCLKSVMVESRRTSSGQHLRLRTLNQVCVSKRLQVLLDALQVPPKCLEPLPAQLRLLVAATCFWYQHTQPSTDLLHALLMMVIYMYTHPGKHPADWDQHCLECPGLNKHVRHAINQWQSCLLESLHFNQLLLKPLEEPQVARCFEGAMMCFLVRRTPKDFLKNNPDAVDHFDALLAVVQRQACPVPSTKTQPPSRKSQPLDPVSHKFRQLQSEFEAEMSEEAEGGGDWPGDPQPQFKMRYKKDRKQVLLPW